jgi:hypothetical protein
MVRDSTASFRTDWPLTVNVESMMTSTLSCTIDSPITDDSLQPIIDVAINVATAPIANDLRVLFIFSDIV